MSEAAGRTVAFIGLGNMGLPMSTRLVDAGNTVIAFDASPSALVAAEAAGLQVADSAADAVRGAEVIVLMLPNSAIVTAVIEDLTASSALAAGAVIVDMSSSEPARTRALAEQLAESGTTLVDAPVSGGVTGAVAGTLTIMVGGADADIVGLMPLFEALGRPVHAGPVGAGHAVKALNNLLSATHLWATSEAIEAGRAFGLDPEVMLAIFNSSSGRSGSTENKWPRFIVPETYDSGFGLALMLKDMRIAAELAQQTGRPSRLGEQAVALWGEAADGLEPRADHTEVARWIRRHPMGSS